MTITKIAFRAWAGSIALAGVVGSAGGLLADAAKPAAGAYINKFENSTLGAKPPEDMLVLNGSFAVQGQENHHFLELAPNPLEMDGLLFGPAGQVGMDVSANIASTSDGKLCSEFGIGSNDAGGYKLILMPAQQAIELRKGDDARARVNYKAWHSGAWTRFRLRVAPGSNGKWVIAGKVWPAADKEPEQWMIHLEESAAPQPGRASIWGIPYAGTPIQFDDLSATPIKPGD